jgi:hypothetical protein
MIWGMGATAAALLAIQLIPYGRDHSNPPSISTFQWDSPRTEELARRACYACHSNETDWPWYSTVAPISWLVQRDVDEGRTELNFSNLGTGDTEVDEAAETVQEGEMPPVYYTWLHPDAKLSEQEQAELISGFIATFGSKRDGD